MLTRIRGGVASIGDYLRDGKKAGRSSERDELDARLVLAGGLAATEQKTPRKSMRGVSSQVDQRFLPVHKRLANHPSDSQAISATPIERAANSDASSGGATPK